MWERGSLKIRPHFLWRRSHRVCDISGRLIQPAFKGADAPALPLKLGPFDLIRGRKSISGSNIGGIEETQELLDFCAEHGITADIETIDMQQKTKLTNGSGTAM